DMLAWMDMSARISNPLWASLDAIAAGEEVIWQVPHSARTFSCLRFTAGNDRELVVLRELSSDREPLARHQERHRARTTETLFYFLVHDLRTLLAAITFNLKAMDDCVETEDDLTLARCVEDSESAVAELQATVDTLVDLARTGSPAATEIDVREIV